MCFTNRLLLLVPYLSQCNLESTVTSPWCVSTLCCAWLVVSVCRLACLPACYFVCLAGSLACLQDILIQGEGGAQILVDPELVEHFEVCADWHSDLYSVLIVITHSGFGAEPCGRRC